MAAGEECTISYGAENDSCTLMRDYGFVVPGNANDVLSLPDVEQLPRLNAASLAAANGFEFDLRKKLRYLGDSGSAAVGAVGSSDVAAIGRLQAALQSLPVAEPGKSTGLGGMFSWPTQPASAAGEPLPPYQVPQVSTVYRTFLLGYCARLILIVHVQMHFWLCC